nr:H-2 class II histocompatibility antigen, E-S beta chain-like [Pogona vitticeps]
MAPTLNVGVLVVAGMMGLVVLFFLPEVESAGKPREQFLFQEKAECHHRNGTERVRLLERHFYDRQEIVRFDSDRGEFEAVTTLGEDQARYFNSQKDFLEDRRRAVDYFCRHNYGIYEPFLRARKVQPKVKITPSEDSFSSSSRHTLLICDVAGFWPSAIKITWFRNGEEEDEAKVFHTDLTRNGDWTFQIQVMLETQLEHGDVYTCQVEHASFPEPVTIQWGEKTDSSRSKMWTGVAGFVLGLVFLAPGLCHYVKTKKGQAVRQPPDALMN